MPNYTEFEPLYHAYKDLVYNLSLQYVQNTTDAEDITQEVFVKIYHKLSTFDPELASIKTWIYRIAINHCLDFLKSKQHRQRSFVASIFGKAETFEPINFDHPGILAEDREELRDLFHALNQLPPNQRTAIILVRIEDRSQKEVAEIMNLSVKAVESLLQRAKSTLDKKFRSGEGK